MSLGPFDPIPPREKVRRSHVNELREALTGVQDAYDVAVANGYTGTRGEWLASLIGPPGDPGNEGPEGPMGPEGPAGSAVDIIGVVDGGTPDSAYGGTTTIDGGSV